jgi:hypothetical protein
VANCDCIEIPPKKGSVCNIEFPHKAWCDVTSTASDTDIAHRRLQPFIAAPWWRTRLSILAARFRVRVML